MGGDQSMHSSTASAIPTRASASLIGSGVLGLIGATETCDFTQPSQFAGINIRNAPEEVYATL